jgi:hypothetical protein
MRLVDWLIVRELLPPLLFGVGLFTTLIFAGGYVFMITEYAVKGIPLVQVVELAGALFAADSGQDAADGHVARGTAGVWTALFGLGDYCAACGGRQPVSHDGAGVLDRVVGEPAGDWLQ